MEEEHKKILENTLSNILVAVIRVVTFSFIGMLCWNHIATVLGLSKLHFIDLVAIYGFIWCLVKIIVYEL